jgi:molecular chaperone HscB
VSPPVSARAPDHFSLLGFAPRFAIDPQMLEAAYQRVQSQVHPDRFAVASAAERRVAMQWATRANEAYRVLRDPVQRAAWLCEMHGAPIEADSNTAMPPAFLMQQMAWREALDEAADGAERDALQRAVAGEQARLLADLERMIDVEQDYPGAAALVRQLMFTSKFSGELTAIAQRGAT